MNLIVITDIFGKTPALEELLGSFSTRYQTIQVVAPYAGRNLDFQDETEVYRTFQNQCGPEQLTINLRQLLETTPGPCDLIGFSVGAIAVWNITEQAVAKSIRRTNCFYGSRIREHLEVEPLCPTVLVFPGHEVGFSIEQITPRLEIKKQVEIIKTNHLHGFMNRLSRNFSPTGLDHFSHWLMDRAA